MAFNRSYVTLCDSKDTTLCAECSTVAATCRCSKCECLMCNACFDAVHKISKYLKSHKAEPLTSSETSTGCTEHDNRPYEYFCEDDHVAICARCVIMGSHKNHKVCTREEINNKMSDVLLPVLSQANETLLKLERSLKTVEHLISTNYSHENTVVTELQEHFDKLSFVFKSRLQKLERDFQLASAEKLKSLQEIQSNFATNKKTLEMFTNEMNLSVFMIDDKIVEDVKDIMNQSLNDLNVNLCHVDVELNASGIIDCIMQHGKITFNDAALNCGDGEETSVKTSAKCHDLELLSKELGSGDDAQQRQLHSPPRLTRMTLEHCHSVSPNMTEFDSTGVHVKERKQIDGEVFDETISVDLTSSTKYSPLKELETLEIQPMLKVSVDNIGSRRNVLTDKSSEHSEVPSTRSRKTNTRDASIAVTTNDSRCKQTSSRSTLSEKSFDRLRIKKHKSSAANDTRRKEVIDGTNSKGLFSSSHMEAVLVSHIHNPGYFWVQFTRDLEQLTRLSQSINDYCNGTNGQHIISSSKDATKSFEPGEIVLSKFHDGIWYRALVIRLIDGDDGRLFEVRFIDYGNVECVTPSNVQIIRPSFLKVPQLASVCSLADVVSFGHESKSWHLKSIEMFARMTSNRKMMMKITGKKDEMFLVKLSWPLSDRIADDQVTYVSDALVAFNLASYLLKPEGNLASANLEKLTYVNAVIPVERDGIRILLTNVVSPQEFYVQVYKDDSRIRLDGLMRDMFEIYEKDVSNELGLFVPFVGMPCLSRFENLDEFSWFRSEIVELIEDDFVRVRSIDYGHSEVISVLKLKKILDRFRILPAQAICCSLSDISKLLDRDCWDKEACQFLSQLRSSSKLFMSIEDEISTPLSVYLSVDVSFSYENIVNFILVSKGFAQVSHSNAGRQSKSPKLKIVDNNLSDMAEKVSYSTVTKQKLLLDGSQVTSKKNSNLGDSLTTRLESVRDEDEQLPKVIISNIISPDEMYIQLSNVDSMKCLEDMMKELNQQDWPSDETMVDGGWTVGKQCIARSSKDEIWYRAKIIDMINSRRANIMFQDFGFKDFVDVKDLHPVPNHFMNAAWYSTRCHLVGVIPLDGETWSEWMCEILKWSMLKKICFIRKTGDLVGESVPVELTFVERLKGTALTPDNFVYRNVIDWMIDQNLARPEQHRHNNNTKISVAACASDCSSQSDGSTEDILIPDDSKMFSSSVPLDMKTCDGAGQDYLPPKMPTSRSFLMAVTYVDEDGCIYGQEPKTGLSHLNDLMEKAQRSNNDLMEEVQRLYDLMDEVQRFYRQTLPESNDKVWFLGQPVAAQFSEDNLFYRGKIIGFKDYGIEVKYVDYGNTEVIHKERLRILDSSFLRDSIQCLYCYLYNVTPATYDGRWSLEITGLIYNLLNNNACEVTIKERGNCKLFVDINLPGGIDVASLLLEKGLVKRGVDQSNNKGDLSVLKRQMPERTVASPYRQMTLPSLLDILHVNTTEIDIAGGAIFLQHVKSDGKCKSSSQMDEYLDKLLNLSLTYCSSVHSYPVLTKKDLTPGTPCVAQYTIDNCWYRAEIISTLMTNGITEVGVVFVDYGSSDFVTVERLRSIPFDHLELPTMCRKCRLSGVEVLRSKDDVNRSMMELCLNVSLVAVVSFVCDDGTIEVDLFNRDRYLKNDKDECPLVYQSLIDSGVIKYDRNKSDVLDDGEVEEEEKDKE